MRFMYRMMHVQSLCKLYRRKKKIDTSLRIEYGMIVCDKIKLRLVQERSYERKLFAIQYDKLSRKNDCSSLFLRINHCTILSVADAVLYTTFGFKNKYNTSVEINHIGFHKANFLL